MATTLSSWARFLLGLSAVCFASLSITYCYSEDPKLSKLRTKAERGSLREQIQLARGYFYGNGVNRNETLAALWFERAANSGDPDSQRTMGYLYSAGIGVSKDSVRAVNWFRRAVSGGSIEARTDLGLAYLWGIGVRKDEAMALNYLRQAAKKGDSRASCYLGDLYHSGIAVNKDERIAMGWYRSAAAHHDPFAQYRLGVLLVKNESRNTDVLRGLELLRSAARAGLVKAKYMVGLLLTHKPELSSSASESESELNDAAQAGFWPASALLGSRAEKGIGARPGAETAYYWFRVARLLGGENAASVTSGDLERLSRELGTARAAEIDSTAMKWSETHQARLEFLYPKKSGQNAPLWGLQISSLGSHVGLIIPIPSEEIH